MNDILITIAIPAYNNEKSIQKTIDSCLKQQTESAYEILIVDDASTDNTPEILADYNDSKIRIVTLKERVPLIANHNICFKEAKGKYILFCHADDTLEEHAVRFFEYKLKQRLYPEKYIVWGHSMFRDFSEKAIEQAGFTYNELVVGECAPLMFFYGGLTPSGTLYSRQSFIDMGGFLKVDMNSSPSDMTTMIFLAMHSFRFEMVDEMVLNRANSSTALSNANIDVYLEELDDAFKYFIEKTEKTQQAKLINLATKQKNKPLYFFYAMAQSAQNRAQIKKLILRHLVKYPWRLTHPLIQKILNRIF